MRITNLLLLVFFILNDDFLLSQSHDGFNHETWNAVVQIQKKGTGFIIASPQEDGTNKYFLITNKHVLGYWSPGEDFSPDSIRTMLVYFEDTLGNQKTLPYPTLRITKDALLAPEVRLHPNPKVDVAAIELKSMQMILNVDGCVTTYFDEKLLVPMAAINKIADCNTGSQIFAVGYPAGKSTIPTGKALLKSGIISSELLPTNKFEWKYLDKESKPRTIESSDKIFIVDSPLYHGNSGSPIIVPYNDSPGESTEQINYIIGIVSSGNATENMTFVFSADYIIDLIKE